ncbi:glycoside hydrolase family 3 C-terminal domain-containing protein [Treponema sp.]|uniref:glycoside hydrolase family 3 C-terminal domain-containing protein n=1 Tax=Treponema sp. TaxID=166 RepID=UPI00298E7738|nr:glycoside hydrolase family 3 C-terminal domain-containing protein [Treponema sp.]MCR5612769.1 glycoside hydrolase family 3 C-terminal domain-containing protein [Treponema sp.]
MKSLKNSSVKEILGSLTIEQKIRLLNGVGGWFTYDADGKLPSIMMTDGPHGLRKQELGESDINTSAQATCFPTASCVANSWDLDLVKEMAGAIADQALKEEVAIVLGCGVNIKRSPMCGRNFEYFSEDPLLAGSLAAAYIDGMQSKNVGTSIKHFACNNQETRRQSSDSIVDERALREIYLRPFEIAVRNTQPTTIMASYNKINGTYTCKNERIIKDILRDEWGFKGAIMSDWGAAVDIPSCIKAGLDLAMPDSGGYQGTELLKAFNEGRISEEEINRSCEKVIETVLRLSKNPKIKVDYKKAHATAKKIAENSAVLLRNQGALPLSAKQKQVVVLGQMAEEMRIQGGGSSHINAFMGPNLIESLKAKGFEVRYGAAYPSDDKVEETPAEQMAHLAQEAVALAKEAALKKIPVILCCGLTNRTEGEGFDRHDMNLPHEQLSVVEKIIQMNKDIIVVTFGGSPFAVPFADKVNAILHMYLAGEACGEACASLLTGEVNPSGKLSESYPFSENDVPSKATWGKATPAIEYRESIFTGYRFYDTFDVPVQYEFGYGLSYTKFAYSGLTVSASDFDASAADSAIGNVGAQCGYGDALSESKKNLKIKFTVKNAGKVAGAEVVQLYVKNPKGNYLRPAKELRAFTKVYLEPGKSKKVTIELDAKAFCLYDVSTGAYVAPSGSYEIQICSSLSDVKLKKAVKVKGVKYTADDRTRLPTYFAAEETKSAKKKTATKTVIRAGAKNKKPPVNVSGLFSHKDFATLYAKPLPQDPSPTVGTFTIYNSLTEAAELNATCKKILDKMIEKIKEDNRKHGRSENDPATKIVIGGVTENPIESMILLSASQFKPNHARAIVNLVNKKKWTALKELLFGR